MLMPYEKGWIGTALSSSPKFDEYADSYGGVARARPSDPYHTGLDEELVIAINVWREIAGKPRSNPRDEPLVSHFGFVDDARPNAFAEFRGGEHFGGIHSGLLDIFNHLGNEIYVRQCIVDVTSGRPEINPDASLELNPDAETLSAYRQDYPRYTEDVDQENILAARYFRHFALIFALFHEFHHCAFGHCAYADALLGASRLNEYGDARVALGTWALHKEVEFLADLGAIDLMFWYVDRGSLLNRLYQPVLPAKTQHRIMLLVISVVCALWRRTDSGGETQKHPDAAQRYIVLSKSYIERLMGRYKIKFWGGFSILKRAALDAALVSSACADLKAVRSRVLEINTPAWRDREFADLFVLTDKSIRDYEYAEIPR